MRNIYSQILTLIKAYMLLFDLVDIKITQIQDTEVMERNLISEHAQEIFFLIQSEKYYN